MSDLTELAKQVARIPGVWRAGMRALGARLDGVPYATRLYDMSDLVGLAFDGSVDGPAWPPDLTDAATVGVVESQVREWWAPRGSRIRAQVLLQAGVRIPTVVDPLHVRAEWACRAVIAIHELEGSDG